MEEIEVLIPEDKNEQKQIARVLNVFDRKIENNLKLNDYLSAQAAKFERTSISPDMSLGSRASLYSASLRDSTSDLLAHLPKAAFVL